MRVMKARLLLVVSYLMAETDLKISFWSDKFWCEDYYLTPFVLRGDLSRSLRSSPCKQYLESIVNDLLIAELV